MALSRLLPLTRPQLVFKKITDMNLGIAGISYLEWLANEYTTLGLDNMPPPLKTAMDLVGIKIASEAFSALHTAATQEKPWEAFKAFLAEAGNGSVFTGCLKEITKYAIKVSVPLAVTAVAYGFTTQALNKQISTLMDYLMEHPDAVTNIGSYMLASVILTNPLSYYTMISVLQSVGEASMNALIQSWFPSPERLVQTHPVLTNAQKVGQQLLALVDVLAMHQMLTLSATNIGPEVLKEWRFFNVIPTPAAAGLQTVRYLSRTPQPIEHIVNESSRQASVIEPDEEAAPLLSNEVTLSGCDKAGIVSKTVGKEVVLVAAATVIAGSASLLLTNKIPPGAVELPYSGLLYMISQFPKEGLRLLANRVSTSSCGFFNRKQDPAPDITAVNDDNVAISMEDIENDAVTNRRCWGLC
ncbi:MAG: hypothetical protein WAW86_08780 [Gammaproteobacteria bacterium]